MPGLSNGNVLLVDLGRSDAEIVPLEEELVREGVGGACIAKLLWRRYAGADPFVLATGPLTATMAPGCALATATMRSDSTGLLVHSPIVNFAGAELKLSGFDFVVIHGRASGPTYLWLHDGVPDLLPADSWWGKDTWATVDGLRDEQGDDRIQVVCIGPAGERGVPAAQAVVDYWSEGDKVGLGAKLGSMNLKAVCSRGLGELEVADPEGMLEKCLILQSEGRRAMGGRRGTSSLLPDLKASGIDGIRHRDSACFGCPWPCRTFLKYNEPPTIMAEGVQEPGVLVVDAPGYAAFLSSGFDAEEAARLLELASRIGIEPVSVASRIRGLSFADASDRMEGISGISLARDARVLGRYGRPDVFSPFTPNGGSERDLALAHVLGICPRYAALVGLDPARYASVLSAGTGMEITADDLVRSTRILLEG
jgi:aldehyde:ferredoxin oxidoreductase